MNDKVTHSSPACSWRAIRNDDVPPGCYTYIPPDLFLSKKRIPTRGGILALVHQRFTRESRSALDEARSNKGEIRSAGWTRTRDTIDKPFSAEFRFSKTPICVPNSYFTYLTLIYLLACLLGCLGKKPVDSRLENLPESIHPSIRASPSSHTTRDK